MGTPHMLHVKGTKKQSWNPLGVFIDCPADINEDYEADLPVVMKEGGDGKLARVDYSGCYQDPPKMVDKGFPYPLCPGVMKPPPMTPADKKELAKQEHALKGIPIPVVSPGKQSTKNAPHK